ncbi:MAG: class II glutamine amidotransferase, partial [Christensenellaceae bacterium]|nr:class II glutamine amidotransferase [Christensenellaceae bacterium]
MCGIIGYVGDRDAFAIVVEGLRYLEYRGYDSVGVAICYSDKIDILKRAVSINEFTDNLKG